MSFPFGAVHFAALRERMLLAAGVPAALLPACVEEHVSPNRDAGSTSAPFKYTWSNLAQGSAYAWKREWENHGWTVSSTPVPGAVAWFPGANHVAYVSGIVDGSSVAIEEYNGMVKHGYAQRIIGVGEAIYLYPPPR